MPELPIELILQVIDTLVDLGAKAPIALPPHDWRAQQLRQWSLVCKATHACAVRHLYSHCLYINSPRALKDLVRTIDPQQPLNPARFKHLFWMSRMYLAPFDKTLTFDVADDIFTLLSVVSIRVERLIVDFPFASMRWDGSAVHIFGCISAALKRLKNLEELVMVDDTRELGGTEFELKSLKRLAIRTLRDPMQVATIIRTNLPELEVLLVDLDGPQLRVPQSHFQLETFAREGRKKPLRMVLVHPDIRDRPRGLWGDGNTLASRDTSRVVLENVALIRRQGAIKAWILESARNGSLWSGT